MDTIQKRKVKVLVNALHAKSGGGATYAASMLPRLVQHNDLDVYIVVDSSASKIIDDLHLSNVIKLAVPKGLVAMTLYEQIHLPRLARKLGVNVVFSLANYGPVFVRGGVLMLRNAMGVGFLDRRLSQQIYWMSVYAATLMSILTAKHVIAVSEFARQSGGRFIERLVARKNSIVHHGVHPLFQPMTASKERQDYALCVSDIYVQKNFKRLLQAFAALKDRGVKINLKIAGAAVDADYAAALQGTVSTLGLSEQVTFLGSVEPAKLLTLYNQCRMFVFPSLVETFGNPLAEAMACGAPVACSNAAAMPEVAGDAAVYFDPLDVTSMADTLENLYTNAVLRHDLSARSIIQGQKYSWDITAEKTVAVLKRVAGY